MKIHGAINNKSFKKNLIVICLVFHICFLVSSCNSKSNEYNTSITRDNTAKIFTPSADGIILYGNELATIDASNTAEGYLMILYSGNINLVKVQITDPNGVTYTYNLGKEFQTFPLSSGNGVYKVKIYENVNKEQYALAFAHEIEVTLKDEFTPFLYPNQFVWYDDTSLVVEKAKNLATCCYNDLDVVESIYNYVITTIRYDEEKANEVESGYIPNVDDIINNRKGICFDYAALMTAMLRSQGIPTKLEVGYTNDLYHAWISTYIKEIGWVDKIIEFDGESWKLMDPTFAASQKSSRDIMKYIGDGSNYHTKYVY